MKLELTPLSPLHIGSDESKALSHLSDYFYDENTKTVCYVDHHKLEKFLREWENSRQIISDFVGRIQGQESQSQEKYNIYQFLKDYKADPFDFVKKTLPVTEPTALKNQNINTVITTGGRPYLPGSSLKGAIRTALLYDELRSDDQMVNYLAQQIQKAKQLKEKWRTEKDRQKKRNAKRDYNKADNALINFQHKIFDRYGDDVFKFLQVSDSSCFSENALKIYHAKRVNINSQKPSVPLNYEGIIPDSETVTLEMRSTARHNFHKARHPKLKPYFFQGCEDQIFPMINRFSGDFVKNELSILQKKPRGLEKVIDFYQKLRIQIENLNQKDEAIFALGRGKSFFNSTIDLLFSSDELMELRKLYEKGYSRQGKNYVDPFPITRTVYYENSAIAGVLGWVKVKKKGKDEHTFS